MSDKTSMPDLGEVKDAAVKLFGDVRKSVTEIYGSYKSKRKTGSGKKAKSSEKKSKEDS